MVCFSLLLQPHIAFMSFLFLYLLSTNRRQNLNIFRSEAIPYLREWLYLYNPFYRNKLKVQTFHALKVRLSCQPASARKLTLFFQNPMIMSMKWPKMKSWTHINISSSQVLWLYQVRIFNLNNPLSSFFLLYTLSSSKFRQLIIELETNKVSM